MNCIEKGIASIKEDDLAKEIVAEANLGYCELFHFKCAGDRTCDAWLTGGALENKARRLQTAGTDNRANGVSGGTSPG